MLSVCCIDSNESSTEIPWTVGALSSSFQYLSCEEKCYPSSRYWSPVLSISILQHTEVTANQLKFKPMTFGMLHRLKSKCTEKSTFGALLQAFSTDSCAEKCPYFSYWILVLLSFQYSNIPKVIGELQLKFKPMTSVCARYNCTEILVSTWKVAHLFTAVSTDSCEEIVYFSRDFRTTFDSEYSNNESITANFSWS